MASNNMTSADKSPKQHSSDEAHDSSPVSRREDGDTDESRFNCSTAQTTPLKHLMFKDLDKHHNLYADYLRDVRSSDLPDVTKSYLHSLASQIVDIGNQLRDKTANREDNLTDDKIEKQMTDLINLIQHSSQACSGQTSTIKWLTELTTFAITPTDIALWSIYRQRSALITKYLNLPSLTEFRLISSLIQLVHAYIYQDYLQNHPSADENPHTQVHNLTITTHAFVTAYKAWLHTLSHFRTTYMSPLLRRIQESDWVRREIEQSESTIAMAKQSLHKRYTSGEIAKVLLEDETRGAEMLAEGRSRSSVLPEGAAEKLEGVGEKLAGVSQVNGGKSKRAARVVGGTRARREHTM